MLTGSVGGGSFAYTVAAIDIGPKPAAKLAAKAKAEDDLCFRALEAFGEFSSSLSGPTTDDDDVSSSAAP